MGELIGLKSKKCVPCEAGAQPLSETEVNRLCQQVGGCCEPCVWVQGMGCLLPRLCMLVLGQWQSRR